MRNGELLDRLVADLTPVRPRRAGRETAIVIAVGIAQLALFLLVRGPRPDIALAVLQPSFWWKVLSFGLLTAAAAATAIETFSPQQSPRAGLRRAGLVAGAALLIGVAIVALDHNTMPLTIRLDWNDGVRCLGVMVTLSVPLLTALTVLMRHAAPTDPGGTALSVGLAAAAWGAFVFMFACPHDDAFFIVVWYGGGCATLALLVRAVLARAVRW